MARSDRLMRLMDLLRRLPPPATAARLADETGVSRRQLYRDIATLRAGGALIDGEAGVGYRLVEDGALPPQSFSRLEIEALQLAVGALPRIGDAALIEAANNALSRIAATLPEAQVQHLLHSVMRSFGPRSERAEPVVDMEMIRQACWSEEEVSIRYRDLQDRQTDRMIRPLGLSLSEHSMMLLGWCRLREDFRVFHCNRIISARLAGRSFRPHRASLLRRYAASRWDCESTPPP